MVLLGIVIIITVLRRTGGPFFFDQNEFLFSNTMLLMLFGAMVIVALRRRRHTGWHRRLMLSAMSILTGPGFPPARQWPPGSRRGSAGRDRRLPRGRGRRTSAPFSL